MPIMIPIAKPVFAKNAKKYLLECLTTGWVSSKGPFVEKFEQEFAKFIGTKYAIAVNSGTASIHLSLAALDIGPGDEVIVPTLTMIATVLPVIYTGATPILIDSDPQTGNIDVNKVVARITNRTKAIIVVHLNGHPVDMSPLLEIAKNHNLAVIEDSAEAQGAKYLLSKKWHPVGSLGNFGCFSFYGNKLITAGEGGMVTTNNKNLADKVRSLRNLDRSPKTHFYHRSIGFTYRMSNLQAALGLAQLEAVNTFLDKKQQLATIYLNNFQGLGESITLPTVQDYAKKVHWNFDILVKQPQNRNLLTNQLAAVGLETRDFVIPMHFQPAFIKLGLFKGETYPIAESISSRGLSLPLHLSLTATKIKAIAATVRKILG